MANEEEDIELTEDEISAVRISLQIFIGMFVDVGNEEPEGIEKLEEDLKRTTRIGEETSLAKLCLSALLKFGEESDEELTEEF